MSIAQTIKKMASEAVEAGGPLQFVEGVVQNPLPNVEVMLKNNSKLIIPSDLITVSEHLTEHTRKADISSDDISSDEDVEELKLKEATIKFKNNLKTGDKVMVAVIQGGQSFFIIDKFKG